MQDPRDRVTEQAFKVDPRLLDVPLATPKRRLLALLLDLAAAAVLSELLGPGLFLLVGVMFLFGAFRAKDDRVWTRIRRTLLILAGIVTLMIAGLAIATAVFVADLDIEIPKDVTTSTTARQKLEEDIVKQVSKYVPDEKAREELEKEMRRLAATATAGKGEGAGVMVLDDEGKLADLKPKPCPEVGSESEPWTFVSFLSAVLETFGLTFGWIGAYFTVFLALGRGRTPAKRALGIRVVRLDGRPLGFWASFERFSGLGAGVATGLLGFMQIYWDNNRQAIHDKISNTVVVRESPGVVLPGSVTRELSPSTPTVEPGG